MKKLKYSEKLKYIRNFTNLGIRKNASFTPQEKRLITKYYNILEKEQVIKFVDNKFVSTVKFVKTKKKTKNAPLLSGYFVKGARPDDKITKEGHIITDNYIKIFIPINFDEAVIELDEPEDDGEGIDIDEDVIRDIIFEAISPYYEDFKNRDYLTMVVQGGFEIGQKKQRRRNEIEFKNQKRIGENANKQIKLREITREILKLLRRSIQKYDIGANLFSGIYLWKFQNQKKPNKKQAKIIKRGKKK